jgi:hypothetical protein
VRHQQAFDLAQPFFRHQDVDIGKQAPRRRQPGRHIGGPLSRISGKPVASSARRTCRVSKRTAWP